MMSTIQQELANLSDEERELLALLLEQEGVDVQEMILPQPRQPAPVISTEGRDADLRHSFPMSKTQERLWAMGQFGIGTALGNVPVGFYLCGPLNVDALIDSIKDVVAQHEILRTLFLNSTSGEPTQTVLANWVPNVERLDLRDSPVSERQGLANQAAEASAQRPFDFANEPSFRSLLIDLTDNEYLLVITLNHLATDGWGARILLQDLSERYAFHLANPWAGSTEGEDGLADAVSAEDDGANDALHFADYAVWHREWLESNALAPQIEYWREQLSLDEPPIPLPGQRLWLDTPSYDAAYGSFRFSTELSQQIHAFSREHGVTLYTTLLAAWMSLLYAYAHGNDAQNQSEAAAKDVLVGTIISNRNRAELEKMIGNFGNNLLWRAKITSELSFADLLLQVRDLVLDGYQNAELPLEDLAQLLRDEQADQTVPIFDNMFILRDSGLTQNLQLQEVAVEEVKLYPGMMALDLILDVIDGENGISGTVEFKEKQYESKFIDTLVRNYERLLAHVVRGADEAHHGPTVWAEMGLELNLPEDVQLGENRDELDGKTAYDIAESLGMGEVQSGAFQSGAPQSSAPRNNTERMLVELWQRTLGIPNVGIHDNYFALGGTSILAVQIFRALQDTTDRTLPLSVLLSHPTVAQLASCIDDTGWESEQSVLVPIQPKGSKPPLFFIHSHGGNVVCYRELSAYLGDDQPFFGLQSAGLHPDVEPQNDLVEMAATYRQAIQAQQPHGPYFLGGWCMGGDLAYEVAQQMTADGEVVALVAMIQNPIPGKYPIYPDDMSSVNRLRYQALEYVNIERSRYGEVADSVSALSYTSRWVQNFAQQGWHKVWQNVINMDHAPSPSEIHGGDKQLQQVADANLHAYLNYERRPYAGPVTLFRGAVQPAGSLLDPTLGWSGLLQGTVEICDVPGYGTGLTRQPKVETTAKLLADVLGQAAAVFP